MRPNEKTLAAYLIPLFAAALFLGCSHPQYAGRLPNKLIFLSDRDQTDRRFDLMMYDFATAHVENLTKERTELTIRSNSLPRINHSRNSVFFITFNPPALQELTMEDRSVRRVIELAYEKPDYIISPDGKSIVYIDKIDSTLQIFRIDLAGGQRQNLTRNRYNHFEPCFTPDGKKIVFVCDEDGTNSIAIMNLDGTRKKILTNRFGEDRYPNVSPEGTRIVFSSSRGGTNDSDFDLYTIDLDGENMHLLYDNTAFATNPVFSPDDHSLVFISNIRGRLFSDIYQLTLSTGAVKSLTESLGYFNQNFMFSPDNKFIVFENMGPADSEIMLYHFDTQKLEVIASHKSRDLYPSL